MDKINVSFTGMEPSDALREYALEKFAKHDHLLDLTTTADIHMIQHVPRRGKSNDFEITVNFQVPKGLVHVNETGEDMYALVDIASDKLFRRMKRYRDKLSQWEGQSVWETLEVEDDIYEETPDLATDPDSYVDYVPKIVERNVMQYKTPMEEAEAIEHMELLGRSQLLFKNKSTGRIAMVHHSRRGGYVIVEVEEDAI